MDHQREQSSQGFIPIQKCAKWTINHQLFGELSLPLWRGIKGEDKPKSSANADFIRFPKIYSGSIPVCLKSIVFQIFSSH